VVAVNPLMHEEAAHTALLLTVVTSSGTYTDTLDVQATLPWKVASGLENVPIGRPVLLHAKDRPVGDTDPYDWTLIRPGARAPRSSIPPRRIPGSTPTSRASTPSKSRIRDDRPDRDRRLRRHLGGRDHRQGSRHRRPPARGGLHRVLPQRRHEDRARQVHAVAAERPRRDLHGQPQHQHALRGGLLPVPLGRLRPGCRERRLRRRRRLPGLPGVRSDQQCSQQSHRQLVHRGERLPETARLANIQCENCHGPRSFNGAHGNEAASRSLARPTAASATASRCGTVAISSGSSPATRTTRSRSPREITAAARVATPRTASSPGSRSCSTTIRPPIRSPTSR